MPYLTKKIGRGLERPKFHQSEHLKFKGCAPISANFAFFFGQNFFYHYYFVKYTYKVKLGSVGRGKIFIFDIFQGPYLYIVAPR